jgi:mannose/cellobiose epimerase-like protein (N-acyl-D-glucosamine 2-epimerase family)
MMAPTLLSAEVARASSRAMAWLQEVAWPFWLARGIDRDGSGHAIGFHEHLTLDRHDCAAPFRRLRVVTRQIYVFSEAAAAGLPGAEAAVALGLDYLRRHAFDRRGGYHWRFDLAGGVIDARRDLYDHAFVLLALASAMRVVPSPILREEARALDAYLHDFFPHPEGGYGESLPASRPRRHNPHMHLLEACLAAAEVFGDDPFLDRADGLVDLFLTRMFRPAEGALPEFFDEALAPHREAGLFVVEPGHHCETGTPADAPPLAGRLCPVSRRRASRWPVSSIATASTPKRGRCSMRSGVMAPRAPWARGFGLRPSG